MAAPVRDWRSQASARFGPFGLVLSCMPKKKRGSRPSESTQPSIQRSNQRRNFLLLGAGAIAAAGTGLAGYRAGWFGSASEPKAEATKPSIARKLPPVTLEPNYENALRSVNELTEYYARAIDNPYVLIHAVRGFGRNFTRSDGSNAVNQLCTAYAADKEVAGKRYVYFERINEVHDNSFLKTFLEAGVSKDQKLLVSGREYNLVDLGDSAKALFRCDPQNLKRFEPELTLNHLPWGLIAFSILMTPDQSVWTNAYGEKIELNSVIDRGLADYEAVSAKTAQQLALGEKEPPEFFSEIRKYSCYGLHSMYSFLSCLRHGYRENNLEQRIRRQFDILTYRLKGDADALAYTYDSEGKGAPPIAVEGLKLRSFVQLLGHCFESINYVRLHKLFPITPSQERRIADGENRLYEYLVRWRAMDIGALERTVDSMFRERGHGVKFMSDLVIALGHASRALKLLTPNNPDLG
jgi:hypothetical protein